MTAPVKDELREILVPEAWRATISEIVLSLVRDDPVMAAGQPDVLLVSTGVSSACRAAIRAYGDVSIVPLPAQAWETSVCRWQGDRWHCVVDLWTRQEGRSDLVLDLDVFEEGDRYLFTVNLVHVP